MVSLNVGFIGVLPSVCRYFIVVVGIDKLTWAQYN